jgi:hypothetical protein
MSKAVGVEEMLRSVGTASLTYPDKEFATRTYPQASFQVKYECGAYEYRH